MDVEVLRVIHNRNLIVDKNTSFLTVKNVPLLYSSFLRVNRTVNFAQKYLSTIQFIFGAK